MKKQLKLFMDRAKAAWDKAVEDEKSADEIAKLKLKFETFKKSFEAIEDSDESEEEDASETAAEKATRLALEKKAKAKAKKEGETEDEPVEVTIGEVGKMIAKSVGDSLKAQLPEALKGQVTEDGIKKIVMECLEENEQSDGDKLETEEVKTLVDDVLAKAMEKIKRKSKFMGNEDDSDRGGSIEIPISWRKGNLPVHAKQLLNRMLKKPQDEGISASDLRKAIMAGEKKVDEYRIKAKNGEKALTQSTSGDLYPLDLSSELQRRLYLSSALAAIMAAGEIDMPSQPYDLPLSTTRPTFYLNSTQRTATTASTPGTARPRLDAKRLMGEVDYSYEADEDSIIPILNMVQGLLADAAAAAYESIIINGDTAGTHQDSDTAAITNAAEKSLDGLRKLAIAGGSLVTRTDLSTGGIKGDSSAGLSAGALNLIAMKKLMGKYGINPASLIWICGARGENDLLTIQQVATLEKFGPRATILTGEIATLFGIPIVVSEQNRENLNASAVFDNVTTTKGSILLMNKTQFLTGRRREFTIETFRNVQTQDNNIVASFRKAFVPLETPSATVPSVILGYNYAS